MGVMENYEEFLKLEDQKSLVFGFIGLHLLTHRKDSLSGRKKGRCREMERLNWMLEVLRKHKDPASLLVVEYCAKQDAGHVTDIMHFRMPNPVLDWMPIGLVDVEEDGHSLIDAYSIANDTEAGAIA
jgi:hypothetical protein